MQIIKDIIETISTKGQQISINDPAAVSQQLDAILASLLLNTDAISGALISTVDGIAKSQQLAEDMDEHRFAAMSSALLALSDNLAAESNKGSTQNVLIEGSQGKIFILHASPQLLLTVFTRQGANLGMSLAQARLATEQIAALMEAIDQLN